MGNPRDLLATVCFGLATVQALSSVRLKFILEKFKVPDFLFEVETIYFSWALIFLSLGLIFDFRATLSDAASLHLRGALSIMFLIIIFSSARSIVAIDGLFDSGSRWVHKILIFFTRSPREFSPSRVHFAFVLIVGPLLGSLITEPAAMLVTAVILRRRYLCQPVSEKFRYMIFAVLFVNVSVGGALTSFAAPAIVVVASKWGWSSQFMFELFGWKCVEAVIVTAVWLTVRFSNEIQGITADFEGGVTSGRWEAVKIGLRLAGFLIALEILMSHQGWWISGLLTGTTGTWLYPGTMALTSILDNAVITSLGSQVTTMGPSERYYLVAGSLVGGGLTLLANAPNLIGFRILHNAGSDDGKWSHSAFLRASLVPTLIAALALLIY